MDKGRLEAFSDGVMAIIITIMVLELHAPEGASLEVLAGVTPAFLSYVLSFTYVAIYWNNHHHMFQAVRQVDGGVLWANNFLLFCLSLVPFATAWMGENHFGTVPVSVYGVALLLPAIAYYVLERQIIRAQGPDSTLARALGRDIKGHVSPVLYLAGIVLAFVSPMISEALYVLVALMWLVPDRRIERLIGRGGD